MVIKDKWIEQALEEFMLVFPDQPKNKIIKFLEKKFDNDFKDHKCILYNNYEMEEYDTTLSNIIDWVDKTNPILTESGTFFKKHSECWNPNAVILGLKLDERSIQKKDKFKYMDMANKTSDVAKVEKYIKLSNDADLAQGRTKVILNSDYGVSGLSTSFSFNMACATSTTFKGQTLIATAFNAFEDFLADNVKFLDMGDCITFIKNIVSEKECRKRNDSKWVSDKNKKDVKKRLTGKFMYKDDCKDWILDNILENLSQEDLNRIYYKCNIYEFFRNSKKASQLIKNIIHSNEKFMHPTEDIPSYIYSHLKKLNSALLEYVHYNYPIYNRSYRLVTMKRKAVITIDTDSNFVNLGPWKDFLKEEILTDYVRVKRRKSKKGLTHIESRNKFSKYDIKIEENTIFRMLNSMAHVLSNMLDLTLDKFVESTNAELDSPGVVKMKNEFLCEKMLTTKVKKHYQSINRLQEGNYFPIPKFDSKGMDFMKVSKASHDTTKFFTKLVYEDVLCAKELDISKILSKLSNFEEKITKSIMNGEFDYLSVVNVKTEDNYKDPLGTGSYKGVWVWNQLYPDRQIELPSYVYLVKVNMQKLKDVSELAIDKPDMFERLMDLFTNNDRIKKSGIKNIAIPVDGKIPKWLKPYINTDEVVMNNIGLILPVLEPLGIPTINRTKSNQFFSNIIQL